MRTTSTRRTALMLGAAVLALPLAAAAQDDYPIKPVTMIVAYAAGGGTDAIARTFAAVLEDQLGGRVIVENVTGAAGNLGTEAAASADPDGYTLLMGNQGPMSVNPHLFDLSADPAETLEPIAMIADAGLVVVTGPKLEGVTDLQGLIDAGKAGGLVYGSAGNASASHLAAITFNEAAGIEARHVPYQGAGPAVNDLVGGHIDYMVTTIPSVIGLAQDGTLTALAVTTAERYAGLPDVPTVQEAGVAGYTAGAWYGLMAPKGIPPEVKAELEAAAAAALQDPAMIESLANDGATPSTLGAQAFGEFIASERTRWGEVVEATGLKVE